MLNQIAIAAIFSIVTLTWEHPAPETVGWYRVEKSYRKDFRDAESVTTTTLTTYDDRPTTNIRTYYRVYAANPAGESAPSETAQVVPLWAPDSPINVKISRRVDVDVKID